MEEYERRDVKIRVNRWIEKLEPGRPDLVVVGYLVPPALLTEMMRTCRDMLQENGLLVPVEVRK